MEPAITVVMPVGDRLEFLAEAIASVLAQSFADFELIAVLDGVSPEVRACVEGFRDPRLRTVAMPLNLGTSNARNAALRLARAPYLALMDSDDVALPQRLGTQHAFMQAHPEVAACGTNAIKITDSGDRRPMIYPETDGMIKARLLLVDSAMINPTVMMRTAFVREHGLQYDDNLPRDEDHRFFTEMMRKGARFHGLQQDLLLYRRHPRNATKNQEAVDADKTRVREIVLPAFFPELSGTEIRMLLKGMCKEVRMSIDEACLFVATLNKAAREPRSFLGEDRTEIRRLLGTYRKRALDFITGAGTAPGPGAKEAPR
jgi:glycosyltransferase involved in cell wall biosynthesis